MTVRCVMRYSQTDSATVLACYTEDYYAGKPAITLNQFGAGRAIYIGAMGDAQLYDLLAKWLLDITGVQDSYRHSLVLRSLSARMEISPCISS